MHLLFFAVLSILSCEHVLSSSATMDTLSYGSTALAGDQRLISANGKFALGFFQRARSKPPTNIMNTYLGIWFNAVPKLTPVWTANRDKPIPSQASPELRISGDGNLIILVQRTIIWSTKANITTNGTIAVLLNSGNLVLQSSTNSSLTFWESFDYPTDTTLSGEKFGWDKVKGLNRRIVSNKNSVDLTPGIYSAELGPDGIGIQLWNSSIVYWSSGKWNGRFFSSLPEMGAGLSSSSCNFTYVNNDKEAYFIYKLFDENIIMSAVMGVSGQRMLRYWAGQDWVTVTSLPKNRCDVYATCGPFTVCTNNGDTFCSCMKGFSVRSPEDWELEDKTGGCIRNTPLNCARSDRNKSTSIPDKFYSIPGVRLPQNGNGILNASSADECAQVCLSNCSCTAYSYSISGCSTWHEELLNVAMDDNGQTLYLRLAAKEVQSSKTKRRGPKILGVALGGASFVVLSFIALVAITWKRRRGELSVQNDDNGGLTVITFNYADLQHATKKFSEKLGEGSFGSVFKGCLSDSTTIAVKRLDGTRQGEKQFRAEVSSIGIIQHINLVKLIGFCCSGDRRLLVYEYMPNHSLDAHLFQSNGTCLSWTIRWQIALGLARGLAYLHHGCRDCIIHCDIKPQNILLDASFVPKIADFGMAKFLGRDFSRAVTTMRGTVGYLAPEWISGTAITSKVDVYSYGMVLLEIISGKRNYGKQLSGDDAPPDYFPLQVASKLFHGDISSLVDAKLHGDLDLEEVERLCKVACWCIQDNELDRPTMNEVVQILDGILQPELPPKPRLLRAIAGIPSSS